MIVSKISLKHEQGEFSIFLNSLIALLCTMPNIDNYVWKIIDFDSYWRHDWPYQTLQNNVVASWSGIYISLSELKDFEKHFGQIMDFVLVWNIDFNSEKVQKVDLYSSSEFTFDCVDSCYWIIQSVNNDFINLAKRTLSSRFAILDWI